MKIKNPIIKALVVPLLIFTSAAILIAVVKQVHQTEEFARRTKCVSNLVHLRLAKALVMDQDGGKVGETVDLTALGKFLSKPVNLFRCPSGGDYVIGGFGEEPRCTHTNSCRTLYFDRTRLKIIRQSWTHSLSR